MTLTRRQLLRNGLALGAAVPVAATTGLAGQAMAGGFSLNDEIQLFGLGPYIREMARGLSEKGWSPVRAGRFDPFAMKALQSGTLAAGFTDEAGLALLTSQLVGHGKILALGRHDAAGHHVVSQRGPVTDPFSVNQANWRAALGSEYARLALERPTERHIRNVRLTGSGKSSASELSFLVQV